MSTNRQAALHKGLGLPTNHSRNKEQKMSILKAVRGLAAGATVIASALAVSVVLATQGYDLTGYQDITYIPTEANPSPDATGAALTTEGGVASWSKEWHDVQKAIPSSASESHPVETF
jgi:hypothetical protein